MLELADGDAVLTYTHEDLLDFHGTSSPAGVAIAYRVLERALPLLSPGAPPQRREIAIATAFGGPGARDGFELATRAVSDEFAALAFADERDAAGESRLTVLKAELAERVLTAADAVEVEVE